MFTENLSTLKINKLTQAQYQREANAGRIDANALYLTPDESNNWENIQNKPFYTETVGSEEKFNITTEVGVDNYSATGATIELLDANHSYVVIFDGVRYKVERKAYTVDVSTTNQRIFYYLGNNSISDNMSENTGEPFFIEQIDRDNLAGTEAHLAIKISDSSVQHSIILAIEEEKVHQIEEKYVPSSMVLLWRNPNPDTTSIASPWTIPLDLTKYDGISVLYRNIASTGTAFLNTGYMPKDYKGIMSYITTSDGTRYSREFCATNDGVVFQNGKKNSSNSTDGCLPIEIYGMRVSGY